MENQTEKVEIKPKNMYISICITQAICIAVILIAILIIKFFFAANFQKIEKWYTKNILDETNISAVFEEESTSEI